MTSHSLDDDDIDANRNGVERLMRDSLQGLAIDPESQLMLNPEQIDRVEELALAFDDSFGMAKIHCASFFTQAQWEAIYAIDRKLDAMSFGGEKFDEEIWTENGLRSHEAWIEIRVLARTALERFGWPCESPKNRHS